MAGAWRPLLDTILGAIEALGEVAVEGREAEAAVQTAQTAERSLWRWRRSVEAAYLDRHGSIPQLVAAVAMVDEVPQVQVIGDLVNQGALVPVWYKLDKWATEHGVSVWPLAATEGAADE